MRRIGLIGLVVVTAWPIAYVMFFFASTMTEFVRMGSDVPYVPIFPFEAVFTLHILTIILMVALTIGYVVHAVRNKSLSENQRMSWITLIVVTQSFGMLWYLRKTIKLSQDIKQDEPLD